VVQELVARPSVPVELRAQGYYLLGNLEFLRREYDAAVKGYDHALTLVPGDDAPDALSVGRDAAHNRALALRLREENKPPPKNPDAGPQDPGDGGSPPDEPPPPGDGGKNRQKSPDDSDQKDPDKPSDDKQPEPDPESKNEEKKPDEPPDHPPDDSPQAQQDPKDPKSAPPPQSPSLSQDDKMLDQLERAPTVQQEAARAQRGRMRRAVEDK
jgi:hypothetical protein